MLDLQRLYLERLTWTVEIAEIEERRRLPAAERRAREGALLLGKLSARSLAVVLDERGKTLASSEFAGRMADWQQRTGSITFLIGGADGHAVEVRDRADFVLSLGPMTWPHLLARALLLEQIYRAQQILAGHPYHRE